MAEDVKADEFVDQLRDQFSTQIRDTLRDVPPHLALQLADTLCAVQLNLLAGLRVNYKAAAKVDGEAVAEDWRKGLSLKEIMEKHGISRTHAYRLHPCPPKRPRKAG